MFYRSQICFPLKNSCPQARGLKPLEPGRTIDERHERPLQAIADKATLRKKVERPTTSSRLKTGLFRPRLPFPSTNGAVRNAN